jgi:hypothetical protein
MPADKIARIAALQARGRNVVMVGDGRASRLGGGRRHLPGYFRGYFPRHFPDKQLTFC